MHVTCWGGWDAVAAPLEARRETAKGCAVGRCRVCRPHRKTAVAIEGDEGGHVTGIKVVKMELGEPDASGRRKPVEVPGSEYVIPVDSVIIAIGTSPNPLIRTTTPGLAATKKGGIEADEKGATSRPGVFAGGDAVTGAATVIKAMGAGKVAAAGIVEYLSNK